MEVWKTLFESLFNTFKILIHWDLFWICLALIIFYMLFYKKFIGFMGEFWVRKELKQLPKDKYIVLNDLFLKSNDGSTHQIDHLVISTFGLFVIETKNYNGLITGKSYYDELTLYLGKNKYKVYNPLHQNYGHIKCLEEILNIDESKFYNVVSFSNRTKIKIEDSKNKDIICNLDFLLDEIKSKKEILLNENIKDIKDKILKINIIDKSLRKEHIKNIKNKKTIIKDQIDNMICPKCGGTLVNRNGKYGNFLGCSNYPKCKYIKK